MNYPELTLKEAARRMGMTTDQVQSVYMCVFQSKARHMSPKIKFKGPAEGPAVVIDISIYLRGKTYKHRIYPNYAHALQGKSSTIRGLRLCFQLLDSLTVMIRGAQKEIEEEYEKEKELQRLRELLAELKRREEGDKI